MNLCGSVRSNYIKCERDKRRIITHGLHPTIPCLWLHKRSTDKYQGVVWTEKQERKLSRVHMRTYAAGKTALRVRREEFPHDPLSWIEALVMIVCSSRENARTEESQSNAPARFWHANRQPRACEPRACCCSLSKCRVIFLDLCPRNFRPQEEAWNE